MTRALTFLVCLFAACVADAETFALRPTASQLEEAVVKGTWMRTATHERAAASIVYIWHPWPYCGPRWRFFEYVQWNMESLSASFVDHAKAVSGNFNGQPKIPLFALDTWRSAAGLNANGFRRVTEWDGTGQPMFAYGLLQASDVFGSWIYEDVQAGLDAFKWTQRRRPEWVTGLADSKYRGDYTSWHSSSEDAMAEWSTLWPGSSWISGGRAFAAWGELQHSAEKYRVYGGRLAWLPGYKVCWTGRPVAIDIYFKMRSGFGESIFKDIDNWGMTEGNLYYHETWPETYPPLANRGGAGEATWAGLIDADPVAAAGITCPNAAFYDYWTDYSGGWPATDYHMWTVEKWNFTK